MNPPPGAPATPATARAAVTADGPGTTTTSCPAARAAATRSAPGSETAGMPASVVSASVSPAARRASSPGSRSAALCSVNDWVGRRAPMKRSSFAATRVSSATTRSASRNASAARGDRSPRLPIGRAHHHQPTGHRDCAQPGAGGVGTTRAGAAARIEVVDPRRAEAHLGHRRRLALELVAGHALDHPSDERFVQAGPDASVHRPSPVDHREQDPVQVVVCRRPARLHRSGPATGRPMAPWPRSPAGTPSSAATARSWLLYRSPMGWMAAAMSPWSVP